MSLSVAEYRFPVKRMIKTLALFVLVLCVLSGCKGGRNVPLFDAWHKLDDTEFKEGNAAFEKAAAEFKDEIETEINISHTIMKRTWVLFQNSKTGKTPWRGCPRLFPCSKNPDGQKRIICSCAFPLRKIWLVLCGIIPGFYSENRNS